MKKVYILRHADKNRETGELTEEGKEKALKLRETLGRFDFVITSDKQPRLIDTARLLTGRDPIIDKRPGIVYISEEQHKKLGSLAKLHPMTHAGVIYEYPEFKSLAEKIGKDIIKLIIETLGKLPENGRALIIAQDAVIVAAEKKLKNLPYKKLSSNYSPLQGYIVNENLQIEPLKF